MKELNHCPSTLADGFSTYSPTACKKLFDGQNVSHLLDFEIDEISKTSGWKQISHGGFRLSGW